MRFWPLRGKTRIVGYPDASYRNNEDKSAATMSTTVAELHGLMRCCGSAILLRGLWLDITGEIADVHNV